MVRPVEAQRMVMPPREHDATRAPRYRFAGGKGATRLKGCPLRQDYDVDGVLKHVACADLRGTMGSCVGCQR